MSLTRSIQFYCGKQNVKKVGFFGNTFYDYEFSKDIAYTDLDFSLVARELRSYMLQHNIRVGYCDISCDFGGGYSLFKRYTFVNKEGIFITRKVKYGY